MTISCSSGYPGDATRSPAGSGTGRGFRHISHALLMMLFRKVHSRQFQCLILEERGVALVGLGVDDGVGGLGLVEGSADGDLMMIGRFVSSLYASRRDCNTCKQQKTDQERNQHNTTTTSCTVDHDVLIMCLADRSVFVESSSPSIRGSVSVHRIWLVILVHTRCQF